MSITDGTILRIVATLLFPDSVIAQNVFHSVVTTVGSYDEDDVVDDLGDYLQDVYGEWDDLGDGGIAVDEYTVYEYDPIDQDFDEVGKGDVGLSGAVAGDMLPHAVCFLTQARTTDPDVNGRKYWGGLTELAQTEGLWLPVTATQMAILNAQWVSQHAGTLTGATFTMGVWSPTRSNFFAFNGNTTTSLIPAYQRRRKPGVGS